MTPDCQGGMTPDCQGGMMTLAPHLWVLAPTSTSRPFLLYWVVNWLQ